MANASAANIPSDFNLRVVIAGGGTGGHLYPGLAIAEEFAARFTNASITFLGTARGVEAKIVPTTPFALELLPIRGLLRRLSWQTVTFPFTLLWSVFRCVSLFNKLRPHLVLGTGGYVAGPALIAGRLLRVPTAVQEQNSFPGLVNRTIGRKVDLIFLAFEASQEYFEGHPEVHLVGNPVRRRLLDYSKAAAAEELELQPDMCTILIFGGSQGAVQLNRIVGEAIALMNVRMDLQFIWIVGPKWYSEWRHFDRARGGRVRVLDYVENMAAVYALADLAVCRAGATTIAELTACGLPAVYIPFPYATADHQTANARAVCDAGGGVLMPEAGLTPQKLAEVISSLIADNATLGRMAKSARSLGRPDAAAAIVAKCAALMQEKLKP